MEVPKIIKSVVYLIVSLLSILILANVAPKFIDLIPQSIESVFVTAVYWVGLICILILPQYFTWFTQEDIHFMIPLKGILTLTISIASVTFLAKVGYMLTNTLSFSEWAAMFFSLGYWIALLGMLIVPQIIIYQVNEN